MNKTFKLNLVKLIHTVIWVIMVFAIFYLIYAGMMNILSSWVYLCLGLIVIEIGALMLNGWRCPLSNVAGWYTDNRDIGYDIFLPPIVAYHTKTVFGPLLVLGLVLILYRWLS